MKPEFSETQYAFAILKEFYLSHPNCMPYMPTQRVEKDVGFDAEIKSSKGVPIFYQFKTADYKEINGKYSYQFNKGPYFVFKTYYGDPTTNQHNILSTLSQWYKRVYYVAPCFYSISDYITYYKAGTISNHSKYIKVMKLPVIIKNSSHSICYDHPSGLVTFNSKENRIKDGSIGYEGLEAEIQQKDDFVSLETFINECHKKLDLNSNTNLFDYFMENGIFFIWYKKQDND